MDWNTLESLPSDVQVLATRLVDPDREPEPGWHLVVHAPERVASKLRLGRFWVAIAAVTGAFMAWIAFRVHGQVVGTLTSVVLSVAVATLYIQCVTTWLAVRRHPRAVLCALADGWFIQRVAQEWRVLELDRLQEVELTQQLDGGELAGVTLSLVYTGADGALRREVFTDLMAFDPIHVEKLADTLRKHLPEKASQP